MNNKKGNCFAVIQSVLVFVSVCLFFGLCYPHHLHYQEQFQLFLFDNNYALEVMAMPGGFADYLGRFATQFFLYAWVGASILGILISAVQLLVAQTVCKSKLVWLCLFTPLFIMRMLCDENALVGSIFAILLSLLAAWGINSIANKTIRHTAAVVCVPIVYWLAGPVAILYALLLAINELRKEKSLGAGIFVLVVFVLALSLPAFLGHYLPIETQYLYKGVHYFRTHAADSSSLWWAVAFSAIPAVISAFGKEETNATSGNKTDKDASYDKIGKFGWVTALITVVVFCAGSAALVYPKVNTKAENVMAYDFMARMQLWNRMQLTADKHAPNNALCATALNLALAKTGLLGERMFSYPQNGISGLLPEATRDAMSPLTTAEVYYHLGMINTAQRYVFEAQEAILDFQKSGRCYKRLAQTNLICGNYAVARKYLLVLQKTLFYRDWAKQTLALLGNEDAINNHKEYGVLRQNLWKEDDFFTNSNYSVLLQKLYESNKQNKMAYEYMLAACMLQKDIEKFGKLFGKYKEIKYNSVPMQFQEALILWWSYGYGEKLPPKEVRQDLEGRFKQYVIDVDKYHNNLKILERNYGRTYWYYYVTK